MNKLSLLPLFAAVSCSAQIIGGGPVSIGGTIGGSPTDCAVLYTKGGALSQDPEFCWDGTRVIIGADPGFPDNAGVLIVNNFGGTNTFGHGVTDATVYSSTGGGGGYASFNAAPLISNVDITHLVGLQTAFTFTGTNKIGYVYSMVMTPPSLSDGTTITGAIYGDYIAAPTGNGSAPLMFGMYIDSLTGNGSPVSTGYGVYNATPNYTYLGGTVWAPSGIGVGLAPPNFPTVSGTGKLHASGDTARVVDTARTPVTSGDTCNAGEWFFDANYFYGCVAPNTIKRIPWNSF